MLFLNRMALVRRGIRRWLRCLGVTAMFSGAAASGVRPVEMGPALPGPEEYRRQALLKEGDPAAGSAWFARESGPACARCHTVDGRGGRVGPDLRAAGDKFGRADLIEAVLQPSARIAVGYATTTFALRSGEEYSGVIQQSTDAWIEWIGADGVVRRHSRKEVASMLTGDVSLMPEGLHAAMMPAAFTDLIEYLASLKEPESAALMARGTRTEVPLLARPVRLEPFVEPRLAFEHPVWIGTFPGVTNGFAVLEHESGRVWLLEKRSDGDRKSVFAELGAFQKGTRGNVGWVFHPRYVENGRYFFAKHVQDQGRFSTHILEGVAGGNRRGNSGRAPRLLLRIETSTGNHYGGSFAFGADGFLYVGMGDGGPQEDPGGYGQDLASLRGKILRLDVDHADPGRPYAVPLDNPLVGRAGARPEIWASGLREPWRMSFDGVTGQLWVGDVGQDRYEEVDVVRRGENMGWNVVEGFTPFSNRYRREGESYVPPVFAYPRRLGVSVTGGFVYRGAAAPSFAGVYLFGDYESRRLFGLREEGRELKMVRQIGTATQRVVSFGLDQDGGLLVVGHEGMIYRMRLDEALFE